MTTTFMLTGCAAQKVATRSSAELCDVDASMNRCVITAPGALFGGMFPGAVTVQSVTRTNKPPVPIAGCMRHLILTWDNGLVLKIPPHYFANLRDVLPQCVLCDDGSLLPPVAVVIELFAQVPLPDALLVRHG